MHTNVVKFPNNAKIRNSGSVKIFRDNVIELNKCRDRLLRRDETAAPVTTDVLIFDGCFA